MRLVLLLSVLLTLLVLAWTAPPADARSCEEPSRVRDFRELARDSYGTFTTADRRERRLLARMRSCAVNPRQAHVMRGIQRDARRPYRKAKRTIAPYRPWLRTTGACESGAGLSLKSGLDAYNPSPFYARYQFTMSTWRSVGGVGDPRDANWLEQAYRAVLVRWEQGTGAWPNCG